MNSLRGIPPAALMAVALAATVSGCAQTGTPAPHAAARGGVLGGCTDLPARLAWPRTVFAAVADVAAGELVVAGTPVAAHCRVTGAMNERIGSVDGKRFAIGFEYGCPPPGAAASTTRRTAASTVPWSWRPGRRPPASRPRARWSRALPSSAQTPATPRRRTVPSAPIRGPGSTTAMAPSRALTPMAKEVIRVAYGRGPDRSYIGGCSNGGRHALVAAARMAGPTTAFLPATRVPSCRVLQSRTC